jgi:hypothetical protein
MPTSYTDVYNDFLGKVTDYDFAEFEQGDAEATLFGYMVRACNRFNTVCLIDLSDRDDTTYVFNNNLPEDVIDVISNGLVAEWIKPKYFKDINLKNFLNTKDYTLSSSPANMLLAVRSAYIQAENDFTKSMIEYSYNHADIENIGLN